jgi:hypothetical protein
LSVAFLQNINEVRKNLSEGSHVRTAAVLEVLRARTAGTQTWAVRRRKSILREVRGNRLNQIFTIIKGIESRLIPLGQSADWEIINVLADWDDVGAVADWDGVGAVADWIDVGVLADWDGVGAVADWIDVGAVADWEV